MATRPASGWHAVTTDRAVPDGLILFMQPFYNLGTGSLQGYEVLIRHREAPQLRLRTASELLPGLDTEQTTALDCWVVDQAAAVLGKWRRNGVARDTIVSVNISIATLCSDWFLPYIADVLLAESIPSDRLLFDLDINTFAQNAGKAQLLVALDQLRGAGFTFCIDRITLDGLSGVCDEVWPRVDIGKLSPEVFSVGVAARDEFSARIAPIIQALHQQEIPVVATGIETREQLDLVGQLGCAWAQGYLLGAPAPAPAVPDQHSSQWAEPRE